MTGRDAGVEVSLFAQGSCCDQCAGCLWLGLVLVMSFVRRLLKMNEYSYYRVSTTNMKGIIITIQQQQES